MLTMKRYHIEMAPYCVNTSQPCKHGRATHVDDAVLFLYSNRGAVLIVLRHRLMFARILSNWITFIHTCATGFKFKLLY